MVSSSPVESPDGPSMLSALPWRSSSSDSQVHRPHLSTSHSDEKVLDPVFLLPAAGAGTARVGFISDSQHEDSRQQFVCKP